MLNRKVISETFKIFEEHDFLEMSESGVIELSNYPDEIECAEQ